ncbi:MAG: hypothetical protein ACP5GJ_00010 [Nanopusillaceae archaeon]
MERKIIGKCNYCNKDVYADEKYRTINVNGEKMIFHIQCFRKIKKEAKNLIKEGFINF